MFLKSRLFPIRIDREFLTLSRSKPRSTDRASYGRSSSRSKRCRHCKRKSGQPKPEHCRLPKPTVPTNHTKSPVACRDAPRPLLHSLECFDSSELLEPTASRIAKSLWQNFQLSGAKHQHSKFGTLGSDDGSRNSAGRAIKLVARIFSRCRQSRCSHRQVSRTAEQSQNQPHRETNLIGTQQV